MENILDSSDFDSTLKNIKTDVATTSEKPQKPNPANDKNKLKRSRKEMEEEEREKMQ
jgi:hypothetical protein